MRRRVVKAMHRDVLHVKLEVVVVVVVVVFVYSSSSSVHKPVSIGSDSMTDR